MDGFSFLIVVATFVIAIIALSKNSSLQTKIAQLKVQVEKLADEVAQFQRQGIAPVEETPIPAAEPLAAVVPEEVVMAVEPETPSPAEKPSSNWSQKRAAIEIPGTPKRDMEQTLASRWFVWIGGAAIAIGGLLFVKYAYDNQLISPALQIILGLLLGAALVAAGEYVRRKSAVRKSDYVPAALSAGGLVTAFGSIFAAYASYELISPTLAFGGLAVVAIGALALSRLQGPLIAALGLIGSYAIPLMVRTEHPSAWSFFPYLLIILAASFATLRGRNWWWLGFAAIAGSAAWTALWLGSGPFVPEHTLPVGLFLHALGLISFLGLSGWRILADESGSLAASSTITPQLSIGLVGLGVEGLLLMGLVHQTDHAGPALLMFFAQAAILVAIAWRKPVLSILALVAAVLSFLVLMVWDEVALHEWAMDEQGLWTSLLGAEAQRFLSYMLAAAAAFTLVGAAGTRLQAYPRNWALTVGFSAVLFITGAWARVDSLVSENSWALLGVVFAGVLLGTAWLGRSRHDEAETNHASGILSIGAALLLLFSLFRLFDNIWLTMAIAGLAVVFAWLTGLMKVKLQGPISAALGSLVTIRLFISRELWNEDRTLPLGAHWPLYGYGVPAVIFLAASRLLKKAGHLRSAITLEGLSLGLLISLVSLELRVLISGGITYDEPQFLEMAAHILTWLGAAYGLMYRQQLFSSFIATWGARILIAGSCAAIVILSLGALNPVVTEEPVPGGVIFNALLLAYLAPVVLLGLITRRLEVLQWEELRPAAGLLSLLLTFVYITLETKRVFQGHIMQIESLSVAESYAYSAVWLVFALALFVTGLRLARQYIRYAGLGIMVLVVLKVFLFDMSNLEGLYRIASFIGLGLCLVGIGWLYQRFVLGTPARSRE